MDVAYETRAQGSGEVPPLNNNISQQLLLNQPCPLSFLQKVQLYMPILATFVYKTRFLIAQNENYSIKQFAKDEHNF